MTLLGAIGIAGSGVGVYRKWLDAVSDNIANLDNVAATSGPAFRARYVLAQPDGSGAGAQIGGVVFGSAEGRLVHEPDHPLADADGMVRYPDIDLGQQMGHLIMAQRAYQANLTVVTRAHDAYEAALQLGRGA